MTSTTLHGRYGPSATLTQISEKKWQFKCLDMLCRHGPNFVDPGGGPFIGIGTKLEIGTVVAIEVEDEITYIIME